MKVAGVVGANRVAKFQCARADDQVGEGQIDPLGRLLAVDPGDDFGGDLGHRMNGDRGLQFIQELPALLPALWRIGPVDAVRQFGDGQGADDHRNIPDRCADVLDHVRGGAPGSFGRDQDAGIED